MFVESNGCKGADDCRKESGKLATTVTGLETDNGNL